MEKVKTCVTFQVWKKNLEEYIVQNEENSKKECW
jgi:hypothetical protein